MNNNEQNFENEKTQEGISFAEIFFLVKKNIVMIATITILFMITGFVYGKFIQKPTYSATTTAIVQVESSSISEYNAFVYAQYLVNSMSEFIVSDSVTKEVAKVVVDKKLDITHAENADGTVRHFSAKLNKELTNDEYEKQLLSKMNIIQSGIKISTSSESLIIDITYSCVEEDEDTQFEVVEIVSLLVDKTKEVAKTLKNEVPTYTFPIEESIEAVKQAYIKLYDLVEVKDASNNLIGYESLDGKNNFELSLFDNMVKTDARTLRQNFIVYYDGESLVMSIKNTTDATELNEDIAAYCLTYLTDYAYQNPKDKYVEEYMYPTFANKLVEMNNNSLYANKSTKTLLITVIAFFVGLVVSCGIILVRYIMDDTFTSKEEIERLTGANVLAYVDKFDVKENK